MSDRRTLSTAQRERLCDDSNCQEHGDGDQLCEIPLYEDDLKNELKSKDSKSVLEQAEPKQATGIVTRSDD